MNPDPLTVWPDDEPEDSGMVIVYVAGAIAAIVIAVVVIFLVAGR